MKARVKATGKIFDIEGVSLRLTGKVLSTFGIDEVEILMPDLTPDYWTRLKHQYAGMAMQLLIKEYRDAYSKRGFPEKLIQESCAKESIQFATALVEKLKESEEKK